MYERRLVVFMGLRCIQGIFIQGLQCVTYSMVMELFSRKYRAMAGCVIEAFWAFGVILLALIAKYVQHWRYIQLAINIPTIATIFYIWYVVLYFKNQNDRVQNFLSFMIFICF